MIPGANTTIRRDGSEGKYSLPCRKLFKTVGFEGGVKRRQNVWYWLKEKQGKPEIWEAAKKLF